MRGLKINFKQFYIGIVLIVCLLLFQNCGSGFETQSISRSENSTAVDTSKDSTKEGDSSSSMPDDLENFNSTVNEQPTTNNSTIDQSLNDVSLELDNQGSGQDCQVDRKVSLLSSLNRVGYGRNTTGGFKSDKYTLVTNLNDSGPGSLREAMSSSKPNWIIFDDKLRGGTIRIDRTLYHSAGNLTIDGRGTDGKSNKITISPSSKGTSGAILLFNGGNTIVHGLTVDGENKMAGIFVRRGDHYWLNQLSVTRSTDEGIGIGRSDAEDTANFVTVSSYHVYNTTKGLICGQNANFTDVVLAGKGSECFVTVHSSLLEAKSRNPRFSAGTSGHVFNSVIQKFETSGMNAVGGSQIIAENNVYSATRATNGVGSKAQRGDNSNAKGRDDYPVGHIYSVNEKFIDGASSRGSINPNKPQPFLIDYSYDLLPTEQVMSYVLKTAGSGRGNSSIEHCK